jgi:hypothetical protein
MVVIDGRLFKEYEMGKKLKALKTEIEILRKDVEALQKAVLGTAKKQAIKPVKAKTAKPKMEKPKKVTVAPTADAM